MAQRLHHHLAEANLEPWLDTARIAAGAVWTKEIEQAIDSCDVAVALLSPGSYQSDICRAEQLRALRKSKRVIPILAKAGTDIPLHLEGENYRDLTGARPQTAQLRLLVEDIQNRKNGVTLPKGFEQTYVTAPPLPRNYVARPAEIERLRQVVIADEPGPSIAVTALLSTGASGLAAWLPPGARVATSFSTSLRVLSWKRVVLERCNSLVKGRGVILSDAGGAISYRGGDRL